MPVGQLDTNDLRALMRGDDDFLGVYSLDTMPYQSAVVNMQTPIKLLVNLDPKSKPGIHWIAITRLKGKGFYFDTFGRPPPPNSPIRQWLARNTVGWKYSTRVIQDPKDDISCGYLCVKFLQQSLV